MRKTILAFIIFTAISMTVFGQETLTYTEVVQVDSVSKDELYNRAKLWLANTYVNSKAVLQIDNKEEGQIICKALMIYTPKIFSGSEQTKGTIRYTFKIYLKDGRYKYEITDFFHDPDGNEYGKFGVGTVTTAKECPDPKPMAKGWSNNIWNDIKSQIGLNVNSLIFTLKDCMAKTTESKNDDW